MISSTAFRMAARRAASVSTRSTAVRHSSTLQKATANNRNMAVVASAAGLVAAFAALQQQETNKTQNFFGSKKAVQATEEKFATYWPRNIMILL